MMSYTNWDHAIVHNPYLTFESFMLYGHLTDGQALGICCAAGPWACSPDNLYSFFEGQAGAEGAVLSMFAQSVHIVHTSLNSSSCS